MADIPTREPESFSVGDYVQWTISDSDYSASSYTLKYVFVMDGATQDVTASDSNGAHAVAFDSAAWTAGEYKYQAYMIDAGENRITYKRGYITAYPDYDSQTTGYDDRSHVKKTLDAIEALLEGKASHDQMSYSIEGRSLSRMSIEELLIWRAKYLAYYNQRQCLNQSKCSIFT